MYQPGDLVVYGFHGVCRVIDLEDIKINGKTSSFLVLEPLTQAGAKLMIPADNPVAVGELEALLSTEDMERMLESESVRNGQWEALENLRKMNHRVLISGKDREGLLREICTLYREKKNLAAAGKRLRQYDENFLSDAEKRICGEISVVMGLSQEDALQYLRRKLN